VARNANCEFSVICDQLIAKSQIRDRVAGPLDSFLVLDQIGFVPWADELSLVASDSCDISFAGHSTCSSSQIHIYKCEKK